MAELSRDDVARAVRDGLNEIRSDIARVKDAVARVDERTNDLDRSQEEIRRVVELVPRLEMMTKDSKIERISLEIDSIKASQAAMTQYLQQIAKYLESIDQGMRQTAGGDKENWRK